MELLNEIWQTARRNKLRTGLTGFAVAWGIFMLIVLLGAGNGLINAQLRQSERYLSNSILVYGWYTSMPYHGLKEGRNVKLNQRDIEITASPELSNVVDEVGARFTKAVTVSLQKQYVNTSVVGVYPNHTKVDKMEMELGRFVNDIDLRERRKVIVLSDKHAKELMPRGYGGIIGQYVRLGNIAFKVVGVYRDRQNGNPVAYSPYTAIKTIYGAGTADAGVIEFTFHGLDTQQDNDEFERDYKRRLNANHEAHPDDDGSIWISNRYTNNLTLQKGIGFIRTFLWIVGLFTLLSGIVGVSNIMLITVKERTHEFGIRKAIGARPWSILRLIIVESVIITTFFGYIGMFLGILANEYMDATLGHSVVDTGLFSTTMFVNPTVGLGVCLQATAVMVVAGTIAGLIPAFKASRIRPIEALRAE